MRHITRYFLQIIYRRVPKKKKSAPKWPHNHSLGRVYRGFLQKKPGFFKTYESPLIIKYNLW